MRKRLGLLLLVSIAAGFPGCAALKMGDGTPTYGPEAWNQAPAPPQRTISNTVPTPAPTIFEEEATKPVGLAKYFPGLQRTQATATAATTPAPAETPKVVSRYRPTWFGLRPNPDLAKPAQPTAYMTDARAGLARPAAEPTMLPVALQVPSSTSANDGAVKPTNVEQPVGGSNASPVPDAPTGMTAPDSSASNNVGSAIPDFAVKPSKPGNDEVNPLPPALGSTSPSTNVVAKMPAVPPVDPQESSKVGNPEPAQVSNSATPAQNPSSDDKTRKAITEPNETVLPPGLPEPVVPASYTTALVSQQAVGGFKKLSDCKVFASPQTAPAPAPTPTAKAAPSAQSVVKPTWQASTAPTTKPGPNPVVPTSLTKPTPQVTPSTQSSAAAPAATTWQRPCLRRLIRRCCSLGEFANPPTAAPH